MVRQPELYWHVADHYAIAVSKRDELKEEYRRIDAELAIELRDSIEDEKKKCTEAMVQAAVASHPKHMEARSAFMESSLKADRWQALKEAFEQRGWALRELCRMFLASYYAESSVEGKETGETRRVKYEQQRDEMAEFRRKNRR